MRVKINNVTHTGLMIWPFVLNNISPMTVFRRLLVCLRDSLPRSFLAARDSLLAVPGPTAPGWSVLVSGVSDSLLSVSEFIFLRHHNYAPPTFVKIT